MNSFIARLAADRAANNPTAGPLQVSLPRAADTGPGGPREAGRQAAAADLAWSHVAALCTLLPLARDAALHWTGTWGTERLRAIGGDNVADAHTFATFADWLLFLEGCNDVAAALELEV